MTGRDGLTRRDVLRLAAAGTVTLTGCTTSSHHAASPTPTVSVSHAPTTSSAPQWKTLDDHLAGSLVRPGQAGYRTARELFNPRFDDIRPQAVAQCASADDVRIALEFARQADLPIAVRAGGHSYGGWSTGTGLVIDVGRLSHVAVAGDTATVGAGARLIDVYASVAARGRALAAGSCPTVGIAGLTLGGGVGVLSRAWGLTCDELAGVEIVTADGQLVSVDAGHHPDLFWACRGGGGGNFGVVTSMRFRLRTAPQITTWYYRWDWSRAVDVLAGWQGWVAEAPSQMWSTCKLLTRPGETSAAAQVSGTWLGDPAALDHHLTDIVRAVGHQPAGRSRATRGYLATMLAEAGCASVSAARCATPRTAFAAASHVHPSAVPHGGVLAAVGHVEQRQAGGHPRQAGVSFDALGGAVADVVAADSAFPHRTALAVAQYTVGWPEGQTASRTAEDVAWLHAFRAAMTPFVGNAAYVNYADPSLVDWQTAYYGRNYPRLQVVKQSYDPENVFHFPQSIVPSG